MIIKNNHQVSNQQESQVTEIPALDSPSLAQGAPGDVKQAVREFYDQVGWQLVGDDLYQNAHYEDLRPVSQEYIRRCHQRVKAQLQPSGKYLLDAGSGPIQYPAYLEYSNGYQYRVCADISIQALKEARRRIGVHGLFVVADVANLPFSPDSFESIVSLHTIHHLPENEHLQAYHGLHRVLKPGGTAVVVNGWPSSRLMERFDPLIRLSIRARRLAGRLKRKTVGGKEDRTEVQAAGNSDEGPSSVVRRPSPAKGTFTSRHGPDWIKNEVGALMPVKILVWRSVSVRFLRNLIFPWLGGRYWLRLIFWLEGRYSLYFSQNGQYPLIVIRK